MNEKKKKKNIRGEAKNKNVDLFQLLYCDCIQYHVMILCNDQSVHLHGTKLLNSERNLQVGTKGTFALKIWNIQYI